jgi:hypothetical protein
MRSMLTVEYLESETRLRLLVWSGPRPGCRKSHFQNLIFAQNCCLESTNMTTVDPNQARFFLGGPNFGAGTCIFSLVLAFYTTLCHTMWPQVRLILLGSICQHTASTCQVWGESIEKRCLRSQKCRFLVLFYDFHATLRHATSRCVTAGAPNIVRA